MARTPRLVTTTTMKTTATATEMCRKVVIHARSHRRHAKLDIVLKCWSTRLFARSQPASVETSSLSTASEMPCCGTQHTFLRTLLRVRLLVRAASRLAHQGSLSLQTHTLLQQHLRVTVCWPVQQPPLQPCAMLVGAASASPRGEGLWGTWQLARATPRKTRGLHLCSTAGGLATTCGCCANGMGVAKLCSPRCAPCCSTWPLRTSRSRSVRVGASGKDVRTSACYTVTTLAKAACFSSCTPPCTLCQLRASSMSSYFHKRFYPSLTNKIFLET